MPRAGREDPKAQGAEEGRAPPKRIPETFLKDLQNHPKTIPNNTPNHPQTNQKWKQQVLQEGFFGWPRDGWTMR